MLQEYEMYFKDDQVGIFSPSCNLYIDRINNKLSVYTYVYEYLLTNIFTTFRASNSPTFTDSML